MRDDQAADLEEYREYLRLLGQLRLFTASVLLFSCCGCPPTPPSQEEQRRAVTSRWITVEPSGQQQDANPLLSLETLDMIKNTVPATLTAVAERVRAENIASEDVETEAIVSATSLEYLELLKVGARVQLLQGRFIESGDMNSDEEVIVLSNELATKLFVNIDPVGESVKLNGGPRKVVGVLSNGAQWGSDVKRDAYVPLNNKGSESASQASTRFRIEMESLGQVKNAQSIIQKIIEQRHSDQSIRVRSFLSDNR